MGALQRVDQRVVERRNVAVVLGAEPLEPGLARVHDERRGARRLHRASESEQRFARLLLVDADAAFDRDRKLDRRGHRGDAFGDQRWLPHQAGAETSALHPFGRAAAIEVDLVIAEIGADSRRLSESRRVRAAELQRHRMLGRIEAEQPLARTEHDGVRRHHFGVETRATRQQPVERPAAPVGPVHHRRDGKAGDIGSHVRPYRRAHPDCRGDFVAPCQSCYIDLALVISFGRRRWRDR